MNDLVKLTIDARSFNRGLDKYMEGTKRALSEVLNQRAFNVAGRTVDSLRPPAGSEQATRTRIKRYMETQISQRLRVVKTGKNKGKYVKKGTKQNQLQLVNLIIQTRRARIGLKGLHGKEMADAEGRFKKAAQVGVGFLKSPFLPIIKGLIPYVRFRKVATRWGRISVWPGSDGYGKVNPAKPGWNPFVAMELRWKVPGAPTKVTGLILPHFQAAFNAEGAEMMRHAASKLQEEANKVNSR